MILRMGRSFVRSELLGSTGIVSSKGNWSGRGEVQQARQCIRFVEDVEKLQKAGRCDDGRSDPEALDYWTFALGPKFSKEDRKAPIWSGAISCIRLSTAGISSSRRIIRSGNYLREVRVGLWRLTGDKIVRSSGRESASG